MVFKMNESNLEVIKMLQKDDLHRHIVFIDSAVDDYPSLVKGVVSGVEVIVLTPTLNGVTQISEVLADRLDIATVHIVSHGSPGCLYLGNTQLSLDTLKCYVTQLQTWFSSLLPQAIAPSLLLYGCNVAAGDAGEEFVERLQQLTGTNIAASAGRIGNAAKGGNWHLERHLGDICTDSAFVHELMESYSGVLASINGIWIAQGPAPAISTSGNLKNVGPDSYSTQKPYTQPDGNPDSQITGAIHTVLAAPNDANILYVGAVNGGIWRTDNAKNPNPTWTALTDNLPSLSIGAMEFDPTDPIHKTIVAGIGRFSSFNRVGGPLTGLLLTTDGGNSFTQITDPLFQGKSISGVAKRGDTILAASNSGGLFRSKDNGATWDTVLNLGAVFDLVGDPSDPKRFYAAVQGQGIFLSADSGEKWEKVSDNNADLQTAITTVNNSNTEMAVSDGRIYVAVLRGGQPVQIAYSDSQGDKWILVDAPPVNLGGQGDIHFSVAVDPKNKDIVYIGGDTKADGAGNLVRRNVSSETQWTSLTSSSAPHVDSREMTFDADGKLIDVDDGGIYRRDNPSGNGDWFSVNGDLQLTEMLDIAYNPVSKTIISANQDNNVTGQTSQNSPLWIAGSSGDYGEVEVDSFTRSDKNQSIIYSYFQRGISDENNNPVSIEVDKMGKAVTDFSFINSPRLTGSGFVGRAINYLTPIALNNLAPPAGESTRLLLAGGFTSGLENGTVFETTNVGIVTQANIDQGLQAIDWTSIPIARGAGFTQVNDKAIAYGGNKDGEPNRDALYVGSENQVFVRKEAGGTLNPTPALPNGAALIVDLALDIDNWTTAFAIDNNQVFYTNTAGGTKDIKDSWTDITGGLNNLLDFGSGNFLQSIEFIPASTPDALDAVVAGTNKGIFGAFSNSWKNNGDWFKLGTELPNAPVYGLDYDPKDNLLVAGTLGRGAWKLPDISNLLKSSPLPKELIVDTLVDENDGDLSPGDVSLREAINFAQSGGMINFASSLLGGTIALNLGQLAIDKKLTINGLGADKLTVSGNNASRIFQIENSAIAEINGLTIQNGNADGNGGGIQIASGSTVNINNSSIFDNKAVGSGGGIFLGNNSTLKVINSIISRNETPEDGGGIASNPGAGVKGTQSIVLNNVTVSENTAGEAGGGIEHERGDLLEVRDSTISGNTAKNRDGGGIENDRSILMLINSTLSGNRVEAANEDGGGVENDGGTASIINSTISGNQTDRFGGGIDNKGGALTVTSSTISGNKAREGGGINNRDAGTSTLGNSIVAGNIAANPSTAEVAILSKGASTSKGFNLVGQNNETGGFPKIDSDITLTGAIDTAIAPLANNGGSTQTHALISGSPAVNAGNNDNLPSDTFDLDGDSDTNEPLPLDQRGQPRIIGSKVDIGAFEVSLPTGSGGRKTFSINRGDRKTIADFGGIGTGSKLSAAVLAEVDTLKFVGTGLTARNLLLIQNGADLELTFEGDANTRVILQDFALENLENLTRATGGNILFNGQNSIKDSFDVVNADFKQPKIFNRNTVTFLNDLSNDILGFDNSNDVINGQDGDDIIDGLSGDDLLRGGEGKDFLLGGTGADIFVGGFGDDFLDLGVNRGKDTVVYRSGDGSDTVRNFNRGKGGDLLDFQNIPAIDVVVNGNSTLFRLSDGIKGNGEFGTGDPFLRLSGTTGFTAANLNQNLAAGDTTQFLFT